MLTTIDKALVALASSGGLAAVLPFLGGPFTDPKFDAAIIGAVTYLLTYLVPNKSSN